MSDPIPFNANSQDRVPAVQREPDPMIAFIDRAIRDPDFSVEKLEALLRVRDAQLAKVAQLDFNIAMSEAQQEMRPVVRDKVNTQTHSKYAELSSIDDAIRPIYTKLGFSLTFGTAQPVVPGNVRVVCQCAHRGGHIETYELEGEPDLKGSQGKINKTPLHALGSTISYLRRYLTCLVFNIVLITEDDDGNEGGGKIRDVADGMGENVRRDPPPASRPTNQGRLTIGQWLERFELACNEITDSDEADRLITSEDALRMKELVSAPGREQSKQKFDAIVAGVLQKWFAPVGEGKTDTPS
jgi:hypothetical protein